MDIHLSTVLRGLTLLLAAFLAPAVHAQSPQPAENPNLELVGRGNVRAVARQPDGGIVVGGVFSSVLGAPRSNVARFNADGTLDPDWKPVVHGVVNAIAVDANGDVFLGGSFSQINAELRVHIAKLSGTTGQLDAAWNPRASQEVFALAIDSTGRLVAGGSFRTIGGADRRHLARLEANGTGSVDMSWNPSPDSRVQAIAVDASGSIFVGGQFWSVSGQSRPHLAKFLPDGQLDPQWRPDPDGTVLALAPGLEGSIHVGGFFSSIGGQSRNSIARLATTGTGLADPAWDPSPDHAVRSIAVDAIGNVYAGGSFKQIGGAARRFFAKLDGDGPGLADPDWDFSANNRVEALLIDGNGDVVAGGLFSMLAGHTRLGVATISPAGSIGVPRDVERPGGVLALIAAPGGGVFAGGWFDKAGGLPRHNLLRIDAAGNLDPLWAPTTDHEVNALAYDPTGALYIGGYFLDVNGESRVRLAKISGSGVGALDPGWNASASDGVFALAVDGEGAVYAGGIFSVISGEQRWNLAKLSGTNGALDANWNPSPNSYVRALAVDGDSIFVGGDFSSGFSPLSIGGQPREGIAKLSLVGTGDADPVWDPDVGPVEAMALDPHGALFVGTDTFGPVKLSLNGDGAVDSGWRPAVWNPARTSVSGLALDRSGLLYAGGNFMMAGIDHPMRLARVSTQGAGIADPTWEPMPEGDERPGFSQAIGNYPLVVDERGTLFVGGGFSTIGGLRRVGLAAFPDILLADGFDGL